VRSRCWSGTGVQERGDENLVISKIRRRRFFDFDFCVFLSAISREIDELKEKENVT
jgi:hypothetical protein